MLFLGYLPVEYSQGRSGEQCTLCTTSHAEVWSGAEAIHFLALIWSGCVGIEALFKRL